MTRTVVWLREDQAALAHDVARAAGLKLVGAGSADRARAGAPASLRVPSVDDLRVTLVEGDAECVWLMDAGDFGADPGDARALLRAAERGVRVITHTPIPASGLEAGDPAWSARAGTSRAIDIATFVPATRAGDGWRSARDVFELLGDVRAISVAMTATPAAVSTGALLYDAINVVESLVGEIDTIDAASGGESAETLRALRGHCAAVVRGTEGRVASISVAPGGAWSRRVSVHAIEGTLEIGEAGFRWVRTDGSIDSGGTPEDRAAPRVIAGAIERALHPAASDERPGDPARLLSVAQAALLSARTGHPEHPLASAIRA